MMLLTGFVLMVLGLISGATLLASSLGWITIAQTLVWWILFPLGSGCGLLLAALGSRPNTISILVKVTASALLLLALIAVIGVVLGSAGMITSPRGTLALWYVFGVGIVGGSSGLLMLAKPGDPA
jgi:hypothetical protein